MIATAIFSFCAVCDYTYIQGARLDAPRFREVLSQAMKIENVKLTNEEKSAAKTIAFRESRFHTVAQNKKSTAFGLFQFLNKTWKPTGIPKCNCPVCQTRAFLRYVEDRYYSTEYALAHHNRKGWY